MAFARTADFANFAGTSRSQVTDYRSRELFDKDDYYLHGSTYYYHLENCTRAINEKVRGKSGKGETADEKQVLESENIPSKAISDARKAHYSAQKEKMSYQQLKGTLVDLDDFKKALLKEARDMREKFESVPDRLAPMLAGMDNPNEISDEIRKEIDVTLAHLFSRFIDG